MKPFIYKRFGRWNLRKGDTVTTIWSDFLGEMTLSQAVDHFQWMARRNA